MRPDKTKTGPAPASAEPQTNERDQPMIHIKDTTPTETTPAVLLTTGEVARIYRVDPETVARWALTGAIPRETWIWTPGGRRRYHADAIAALLNGTGTRNGAGK